ncbi:Clavaminate synthase-like protein [Saitoella complicata NRRL Y-17804]|uniref:JmjC domain-containing protein n=1 Tax=Saitoella complicata (strain BCRC 22490 / CBS 7301 / JCM 7358 / NBRC 10748 / NRRL Y-17804) TaxID=698492 RepID=A0A0E9NR78_SAICN|nr:Clavaminate synthase-like protein [Saitoella complicata NRRL Y-17804]ODQ49741.1 Clavaminate synthase-like protein [Saitoella complicata NRRL Y-17804]GAO52191.1 hypothetical protein G7K_6274-t1 [Saitoella complicata NRRL Y-17804]
MSTRLRSPLLSRSISSIPTLSPLTPLTYHAHTSSPAPTPILLPATFSHLPAIQKWFRKDDKRFRYLKELIGGRLVVVEVGEGGYTDPQTKRVEVPFGLFVDVCLGAEVGMKGYLAQSDVFAQIPTLLSDLQTPYLPPPQKTYSRSLWLGKSHIHTPLHTDPNDNVFLQLHGTKRIRLYPPTAGAQLRPGQGVLRNTSMIRDVWSAGADADAGGSEVEGVEGGMEAVLREGDGVFIPRGWWHTLKGENRHSSDGSGDEIVCSVNWWFRP